MKTLLAPARLWIALLACLILISVGAATPTHAAPAAPFHSVLSPPPAGLAHPAPSVIHDMVVTLNKDSAQVWTRFMVSAPLVPQVFRTVDTDGDGTASPAEQQAWVTAYAGKLQITLDDQPVVPQVTQAADLNQEPFLLSMRTPVSITLALTYDLTNAEEHRFKLVDGSNYVGYDEYYISYEDSPGIIVTANDTTGPGTFESIFDVDATAPATRANAPAPSTAPSTAPARPSGATPGADVLLSDLSTFLRDPRANLGLGLIIFGLAVLIGGIHALTPGHGKAMVAAYLVGSRGRVSDAVLLGGVVTFTHTISVVGLGLILLLVNNFVLPAGYQAALELLSGLLIVGLGAWLLWTRWRALRMEQRAVLAPALVPASLAAVPSAGAPASAFAPPASLPAGDTHPHSHAGYMHVHAHDHAHDHDHAPDHPHDHAHDGHSHSHDGHTHTHVPPPGASLRDLIGLGVSGGLVPCPDALAILFLAVSVQQIGLGIALVGSFSLGLAFVLISIGVLLVKARGWLERVLPGRSGPGWAQWLPVVSAAVVIILGLFVIAGALAGRWS
jgi:ABC-type nickel/cobalt efflux system permease component RcnA